MQKRPTEKIVKEGTYRLLATLFKILSNPDRLQILDLLNPESHTFTEIMFTIGINPAVVNRHLAKLQEFNLIEKNEDGAYKTTDIGKLALNATSKDILGIVEEALEVAKAQGILKED